MRIGIAIASHLSVPLLKRLRSLAIEDSNQTGVVPSQFLSYLFPTY
ncbi:MAG: hypothetical protein MUF49_11635 [Oculatellaceae cyanobacterium Prado106]|nr:hypothetical protein [Oculatellaceae cyanobacterium Prado106]